MAATALGLTHQLSERMQKKHFSTSWCVVCTTVKKQSPGAQTERRGDAEPVLFGG
jgi:hypothetical protein